MFVAASHSDEIRVKVFSSTFRSGFTNLKQVRVPRNAILSNTFTLMDTSEDQVFLFLENHGQDTPFGDLYISDIDGRAFSLSLDKVIKGTAVDFEKVNSLDGTYIVNRYELGDNRKTGGSAKNKKIGEFDESDIYEYEEKKNSKNRMGHNQNAKQTKTQYEMTKMEDTVPGSIVQQAVRTYITHNKGASWELIASPHQTPEGKPIDCYVEDGCSINLEIYSHNGELAPIYSVQSAIGIVIGTGNIGEKLTLNGA